MPIKPKIVIGVLPPLILGVMLLAGCGAPERNAGGSDTTTDLPGPPPARERPAPGSPARIVTGRAFLVENEPEEQGYALYSYVLFGSPPTTATRARYLACIHSFLQLEKTEVLQERYEIPPERMNISYLPITRVFPDSLSEAFADHQATWVLDHYNYTRARLLLDKLPESYADGPYIVSYHVPLSRITTLSDKCLFQDLSHVSPPLVSLWMREFLDQASRQQYWDEDQFDQFVLKFRNLIAIAAEGLPGVQAALDQWIVWLK